MWLRTILSAVAATGVFISCGEQPTHGSDADPVANTCNACRWERAAITLVDATPTDSFTISAPIAIEYFTLAKRDDCFDSLPDNHQTYYRTVDQYGFYITLMKPSLKSRGIQVIDTLMARNVLFFEDSGHEYIVNAAPYFHSDGVLLFTPGKAPVFWTTEMLNAQCSPADFLACYFGEAAAD